MEYTTLALHSVSGCDMHIGWSMFNAGNTYWGMTSTSSGCNPHLIEDSTKRPQEGMMYSLQRLPAMGPHTLQMMVGWMMSDVDPPREPGLDGAEVVLFFEPEFVLTEPEDVGGLNEEEEDLRFMVYSSIADMHNVDLLADDVLEFSDILHKRRDCTSSSLDSSELEVDKEFFNKDSFLDALKEHDIINGVNYNIVKFKSEKFEAKCAVQDDTCLWKIMASVRKKTGLWEISTKVHIPVLSVQ